MITHEIIKSAARHLAQTRIPTHLVSFRLRVDNINRSYALDLAKCLTQVLDSELAIGDVIVRVLASENNDDNLEINHEKAIELRNRNIPIILIAPEDQIVPASLENAFSNLDVSEIFNELSGELIAGLKQRKLSSLVASINRHTPNRLSALERLRFWSAVSIADNPAKAFGEHLWMLGLIPDLEDEFTSRLGANVKASNSIFFSAKSMATVYQRLLDAGVRESDFRLRLETLLDPLPDDQIKWCKLFVERHRDMAFEHWPLVEKVESDLESIAVEPFRDTRGQVVAKCKLVEVDGTLTARGKVTVSWILKPQSTSVVKKVRLEVVPAASPDAGVESQVLLTVDAKPTKKSQNLVFDIDEDQIQELAPRYVVRISVLDENEKVIELKSGELAIADSDEFAIEGAQGLVSNDSRNFVENILLGELDLVIAGHTATFSEVAPSIDFDTFSLQVAPGKTLKIKTSPLLIAMEAHLFSEPTSGFHYEANGQAPETLKLETLQEVPIALPKDLSRARAEFFSALSSNGESRRHPAFAKWNEDTRRASEKYLEAYRRAISGAEGDDLVSLLSLDSLDFSFVEQGQSIAGRIVLSTHPLRAAWLSQYDSVLRGWMQFLEAKSAKTRKYFVDRHLVNKISPANLPFAVPGRGSPYGYFEELIFGYGLYFDLQKGEPNYNSILIRKMLDLGENNLEVKANAALVTSRIDEYLKSHPVENSLTMLALNAADGGTVSEAVRPWFRSENDELAPDFKVDVWAFSDHVSYANPVPKLVSLAKEQNSYVQPSSRTHLIPPILLRATNVDAFANRSTNVDANLAVIQGISNATYEASKASSVYTTSVQGLITPICIERNNASSDFEYIATPTFRNHRGTHESKFNAVNELFHSRLSEAAAQANNVSLVVRVKSASLETVDDLHVAADWVLTLDRYLGANHLSSLLALSSRKAHVLDYSPEFIEGFGSRLTVTTNRTAELLLIVSKAMVELGLENTQQNAEVLLSDLAAVSGKLALKLLGQTTFATEAVGLAAVVKWLRHKSELQGAVIIPLDAHQSWFKAGESSNSRCDLLVVRFTARGYTCEWVEVKTYQAGIGTPLYRKMHQQIKSALQSFEYLYADEESAPVDNDLRWARWAGIMHFYAEKSASQGYLDVESLKIAHEAINRISSLKAKPSSQTKRGFIVHSNPVRDAPSAFEDMKLTFIGTSQLHDAGLTTRFSD